MGNLEEILHAYSIGILYISTVVLLAFAVVSLMLKRPRERVKKILFFGIVAEVLIPTLYLIVSTVYLNSVSVSKGPVHWHADFEIWACGQEIELLDPKGLSNKIGTNTLHEHNDKRIHLEGVVVEHDDASLGRFFSVIGGRLTATSFTVPTNNGYVSFQNGNDCVTDGKVQVFVYQVNEDQTYTQKKLENPQDYIISPYSGVPKGDCIIVEYDTDKFRTEKICRSYRVAKETGKLKGEVFSY
jgi:hypothetical protein